MDKKKRTAKPAVKQAPPIALADLTITWGGTDHNKKNTITGAQLDRLLGVVRWTNDHLDETNHGGDCWPLANSFELAEHLRAIAQLIRDMDQTEGHHELDGRFNFLSSAQMLLAACVMCDSVSDQNRAARGFYRVHVAHRPAAAGGAR